MFFELIGTLIAGAAAALIIWALNRSLKGRLPGWLMPAGAGAAMLLATITSEYGWYERTRSAMPEGLEVAEAVKERAFYRPWTYLVPFVTRFVAVDMASMRQHPDQPGQRMVDLIFYGRWSRTAKVPVIFDCPGARRAEMAADVAFATDGSVQNALWRDLRPDDPVLKTACEGG